MNNFIKYHGGKYALVTAILVLVIFCVIAGLNIIRNGEVYVMKINFDANDVQSIQLTEVETQKIVNVTSNHGKAVITYDKKSISNIGSIKVLFKSLKYGQFEYIDSPIVLGRSLTVNFINGRITISVENSGYL